MKSLLLPVTVLGVLVFLLGLITQGTLCRQSIENQLTQSTRDRLVAAGFSSVNVAFDYLDARLTGEVATEADRSHVAKIVGELGAVRLLKSNNQILVQSPPSAAITALGPVSAALTISRQGNRLELLGVVPDRNFVKRLESKIKRIHPNAKIDSQLVINGAIVDGWWVDAALPTVSSFLSKSLGDATIEFQSDALTAVAAFPTDATRRSIESSLRGIAPARVTPELSIGVMPLAQAVSMNIDLVARAQQLELHGEVPDQGTKEALLASIKQARPAADLIDRLDISPQVIAPSWAGELHAITKDFLASVPDGELELCDDNLRMAGEVATEFHRTQLNLVAGTAMGGTERFINELKVKRDLGPSLEERQLTNVFRNSAVYFSSGGTAIGKAGRTKVLRAAEAIKVLGVGKMFHVFGYADSLGNAKANRRLSLRRAERVKELLVLAGILRDQLIVESVGEEPEGNATELWKSRRVELSIAK